MEVGTNFSFKEIGVDNELLMFQICYICDKLNLDLISADDKKYIYSVINTITFDTILEKTN